MDLREILDQVDDAAGTRESDDYTFTSVDCLIELVGKPEEVKQALGGVLLSLLTLKQVKPHLLDLKVRVDRRFWQRVRAIVVEDLNELEEECSL